MYLKSYLIILNIDVDCLLRAFQIEHFLYTAEENANAGKEFELLQEKNMKIGKGVCDNIRSNETTYQKLQCC